MQHFTEANVNINGNGVYKAKVELEMTKKSLVSSMSLTFLVNIWCDQLLQYNLNSLS